MTRLTADDLEQCTDNLNELNERLTKTTKYGLLELALMTTGMAQREYRSKAAALKNISVIPITSGQGVITGFAKRVVQVGFFLGLPCMVTKSTDVAGWGEAVGGGSEIMLCADDQIFLAINLNSRKTVSNSSATGEIFAAALLGAAGDVVGRIIGILGLGPVGDAAAKWLYKRGAKLTVHDKDKRKQEIFLSHCDRSRIRGLESVDEVLYKTDLVIDATNNGDTIQTKHLKREILLSAPGIPLGIDDPVSPMVTLIHDSLYMGVAAMMVQALK